MMNYDHDWMLNGVVRGGTWLWALEAVVVITLLVVLSKEKPNR